MENINEEANLREYFLKLLSKSEIKVSDEKITQMLKFLELLYNKNQIMNLTAIRDKKGMLEKHFIDSLLLTKVINDDEKSFIDVGTGAGFPGLVLAIYYPEKKYLLVDSVRKKIEFINEVIKELNLQNVTTSFERSEELIKDKRESFDVALCRGVANLRIISEYMIPFIKVNRRFLPQKLNLNEVEESKNALKILNSKINKTFEFKLPESKDTRIILEIIKLQKTNIKYPRKVGIPVKKPL
ncbi:16S rRNA (guanine(527)-N(7))-methyltransferase RsmG [Leptotrichia alba]|uniref:Ribosomal RNA small subunit methyltransferase G n=1 Tax=Leptotrichia alba TaxID=3239304 RepID=A0AB39V3Q8_9FUSO